MHRTDHHCPRPSASAAAPMVALQELSLRYGHSVALADITLQIPSGQMVGLIGPDGEGKSSLLALVAGARRIQQGSVQVP